MRTANLCPVLLLLLLPALTHGSDPLKDGRLTLLRGRKAAVVQKGSWRPLPVAPRSERNENTEASGHGQGITKRNRTPQQDDADGFFEARRFFRQNHLDHANKVDFSARSRAITHRDQMARFQPAAPSVGPRLATGLWTNIGPTSQIPPGVLYSGASPVAGRVNAVEFDPKDPNIIYLGTAAGGLWRSTDAGQTWSPLTDNWPTLCVSSIAIDKNDTRIIYVGTGDFQGLMPYSCGIMKSTDGGFTWTNYGRTLFGSSAISKVMLDPDDQTRVTVTTGRGYDFNAGSWEDWMHGGSLDAVQGGIYQSTDSGVTWTKRNAPYADWCGIDVSTADANGNRTYWAAGTYPNNSYLGTLWYSNDRGLTWSPAANANGNHIAMDVACSKVDRNTVYLLVPDSYSGAYPPYDQPNQSSIFKSTDAGTTWSDITAGFPTHSLAPGLDGYYYNWSQGFYDFYIRTSTATRNGVTLDALYVGLITLAMSPDAGAHWLDLGKCYSYDPATGGSSAQIHVDQHAWAVSPKDPNTVIVGNDGGVYECVYDPRSYSSSFAHLNHGGLILTQFYQIATNPGNPSQLIGGAQDNGSPLYGGSVGNWQTIVGGDGGICTIDQKNPLNQFVTSNGLQVARTGDGWNTGQWISDNSVFGSEPRSFIPPVAVGNSGELLAATDHLWRWTPAGGWTADLGGQALSLNYGVRTISPCAGTNRLYTGSQDGQIWTSPDAGASWQKINGGVNSLPVAPIVGISPSPASATDILICETGYGHPHLWRCQNVQFGNYRTWINLSGSGFSGLPDVPVNSIVRDPYSPLDTWYAGTDVGVFVTRNSGSSWMNMSTPVGLPNVQVTDLKVSSSYLYAATFGRGVWRIRLVALNTLSVASISAPTNVIGSANAMLSLQLNATAAFGGAVVKLASSNPCVVLPSATVVPNGANTFTMGFRTFPVTTPISVTLTATLGTSVSTTVLVQPGALSGATVPSNVVGGVAFNAKIDLTGKTPADAAISIAPSSMFMTVPTTVIIPAGSQSGTFQITATPTVYTVNRFFYAKYLGLQRLASFTVNPPSLATCTISPNLVHHGDPAAGTISLNGPAPNGGWPIRLISSNPAAALPPGIVWVPAGSTSVTFAVRTSGAASSQQVVVVATPTISGATMSASFGISP